MEEKGRFQNVEFRRLREMRYDIPRRSMKMMAGKTARNWTMPIPPAVINVTASP